MEFVVGGLDEFIGDGGCVRAVLPFCAPIKVENVEGVRSSTVAYCDPGPAGGKGFGEGVGVSVTPAVGFDVFGFGTEMSLSQPAAVNRPFVASMPLLSMHVS